MWFVCSQSTAKKGACSFPPGAFRVRNSSNTCHTRITASHESQAAAACRVEYSAVQCSREDYWPERTLARTSIIKNESSPMILLVRLPVQPSSVAFGRAHAGLDGVWLADRSVGDQ
jgi:hypothetical protein|eukprot:COSAG06_NODE_2377_length_6984_cov_28.325635_4_plen_116_part_00